jgi:hypothetical protein
MRLSEVVCPRAIALGERRNERDGVELWKETELAFGVICHSQDRNDYERSGLVCRTPNAIFPRYFVRLVIRQMYYVRLVHRKPYYEDPWKS